MKVLGGESTADTFRRATREMKAFASVRSPYLVTLYDAGQHDGIFYYSMEYLPEGSLAEPAHGAGPRRCVVRAVADAARAAAACTRAGIVHRDIKPSNVLLTTVGAKLSDLGLSQVFTPGVTLTGMGPIARSSTPTPTCCTASRRGRTTTCGRSACMLHRAVTGIGVYGELPADDGLLALRRILSTKPEISPTLPAPLAEHRAGLPRPGRPSGRPRPVVADRLAAAVG